jgi:WD40 repeat protein
VDLKTERELATLGHDDWLYGLDFSEDGQRLITISADGGARVWDVPAVLRRNLLLTNSTDYWWLRKSADDRLLASADVKGTIHIWDRFNRTVIHSQQTDTPDPFVGLTFEPQGHRLAWASRTSLGIFDLQSGRTNIMSIAANEGMFVGISFSPDNREIMFGSSTNVMLCELATLQLRPFAACEEEVYSIAYSPDGTLLAFGHDGGAVSPGIG